MLIHYEEKSIKKSEAVCEILCLGDPFGDLQGRFNLNCPHHHFALGQEFLPMPEHVGQKEVQWAQTEKEKDEDKGKSHSEHLREEKQNKKLYTEPQKTPNSQRSSEKEE